MSAVASLLAFAGAPSNRFDLLPGDMPMETMPQAPITGGGPRSLQPRSFPWALLALSVVAVGAIVSLSRVEDDGPRTSTWDDVFRENGRGRRRRKGKRAGRRGNRRRRKDGRKGRKSKRESRKDRRYRARNGGFDRHGLDRLGRHADEAEYEYVGAGRARNRGANRRRHGKRRRGKTPASGRDANGRPHWVTRALIAHGFDPKYSTNGREFLPNFRGTGHVSANVLHQAAKRIAKLDKVSLSKALSNARHAAARMPGHPTAQAIAAEGRVRKYYKRSTEHLPIGTGERFAAIVAGIMRSGKSKEAARAIAAANMRRTYGNAYVNELSVMGRRRADRKRKASGRSRKTRRRSGGRRARR